jgi:peptidoglycan/LPS O-acetylase OafA/YrhL
MASGGPSVTLVYRPALDGLRGIAVLLVLLQHFIFPLNFAGTVGVTLFFVLSGYLITRILLKEHGDTGRINFRAFYARRVRRLLPALASLLAVIAANLLSRGESLLPVAFAAGYASNIASATGFDMGWLGHTWTLSLEEQFYFAWPLLMPFVVRRRPFLILVFAAGASAAMRTGLWLAGATFDRVYYGPDVRVEAILIGCALAFVRIPTRHLRPAAAGAVIFLISCILLSGGQFVWLLTPAAIASAVLVAWAIHCEPRLLTLRPLVGLGKISYGLYLWHYLVGGIVGRDMPLGVRLPLLFTISLGMAILSWYVIERPFTRRKPPQVQSDPSDAGLVVTGR